MQKIDFKNKGEEGYESSKLNADNLNLLQANVEAAINSLNSENENTYSLKKDLSNISFNDLMNYGSGLFFFNVFYR